MKKTAAVIMAACMLLPVVAGCGSNLNVTVPQDTQVTLTIEKEKDNRTVFGIGGETDPHFFTYGVGRAA